MRIVETIVKLQTVSTPLVAVEVTDHIEFRNKLVEHYVKNNICFTKGNQKFAASIYYWDINTGVVPLTQNGRNFCEGMTIIELLTSPFPTASLVLVPFISDLLRSPQVQSALTSLRESLKNNTTLVIIDYSLNLPPSIQPHCIFLYDDPPDEEYIKNIVRKYVSKYTKLNKEQQDALVEKASRALAGLGEFLVEQIVASNISPNGLSIEDLWRDKQNFIRQTAGLELIFAEESLDNLEGLDHIKELLMRLKNSSVPFNTVVWIDEIEKMIAGSEGRMADNTGVSQRILQTLLTYMQENDVRGMIFVGPPGTGKSATAKGAGRALKIPTIMMDIGAMMAGIVGSTESNVRRALNIIKRIAPKQLWIATCNDLTNIPSALRRRFNYGIWFFDIPDKQDNSKIWNLYKAKYGVDGELPQGSDSWTGAEIKTCCSLAKELNLSICDVSSYIVPVVNSMGRDLTELREKANGRFNSASYRDVYRFPSPHKQEVRRIGE